MPSAFHTTFKLLTIMRLTALRGTENTGAVETTTQSRDQPRVNFMLAYAPKKVELKVVQLVFREMAKNQLGTRSGWE
jgi:hypothetical protein